jgi:hypothetical protein
VACSHRGWLDWVIRRSSRAEGSREGGVRCTVAKHFFCCPVMSSRVK